MKRFLSLLVAMTLAMSCALAALAETESSEMPSGMPSDGAPDTASGTPPTLPDGQTADGSAPSGTPPEKPEGTMPSDGAPNGAAPDGMGAAPGGQSGQPESYSSVTEITEDTSLTGSITSTGTDENALHVTLGTLTLRDAAVERTSADSTGGDASSFYGVGAAILATGGTAVIRDTTVTTDAAGGAGVFAYGDGVVYVSDSTITTAQDTSGGIHVAGGGTLYAKNLTVTTAGESSAAIRSDRGSGTMVVDGGTYTATGVGSPAVYVTADISVNDAVLTATGSEALCLEGLNTVRLYDCALTGSMQDLSQNDNTWTVILYQSMSGDSAVGEGRFEMSGGTLTSANGGLFYTTNTESEFVLSNVEITAAEDSEYFLRCTGNSNQRGWGASGANGADCVFTGIGQAMNGDVLWDSISNLQLYLTQNSTLTGAVLDDESCAGIGGNGACVVNVDESSVWVVTADSVVTTLNNAGTITDADSKTVSIIGTDGTLYVQGDGELTITVSEYSTVCELTGAGTVSPWSDHAMTF